MGRAAGLVQAAGRRRGVLLALGVLFVALVATLALVNPWTATNYELGDTGVWVAGDGKVGRLNGQIAQIDFVAPEGEAGEVDAVAQDGREVYLRRGDVVTQIDPADPRAEKASVDIAGADKLAADGGTAAVMTVDGAVHVVASGGRWTTTSEPVMELGDAGQIAVGVDGTLVGYAPSDDEVRVLAPGDAEPAVRSVPALGESVDVTLAGDRPVLLDRSAGTMVVAGGDAVSAAEVGDELRLGLPVADSGRVLVASTRRLAWVSLGDGSVTVVSAAGTGAPGRAAAVGECVGVAWSGSDEEAGNAVVDCADAGPVEGPVAAEGAEARAGGSMLVFDAPSGDAVWVVFDGELKKVSEWPVDDSADDQDENYEPQEPNRVQNEAPVAESDTLFQARVGERPVFDVMWNDHDGNQDPMTVVDEALLTSDERVTATVVRGGRGIEVNASQLPPEAVGQRVTFTYRVSDGQTPSESAEVSVEVVPSDDPNAAPLPKGASQDGASVLLRAEVEVDRSVRQEVVSAFVDPEGDAIALARVELAEDSLEHQVRTRRGESGFTFSASSTPGTAQVTATVVDALGASADSTVTFAVRDAGPLAPHTNNDIALGAAGTDIVIEPLLNDVDPNGDELTLRAVEAVGRAGDVIGDLDVDPAKGTITVNTDQIGLYVLHYQVSDPSGEESTGVVLVNVPGNATPVVLPDVVVVEPGGEASVDLLANDVDPDGDLLAVENLTEVATADVVVHVEEHRTLMVDAYAAAVPDGEITVHRFTYFASDGGDAASADVAVLVMPATGASEPPDALDPRVTVRVNDVVTVPLADLAWDADGDPLDVELDEVVDSATGSGTPFMSGEDVRFRADASPGVVEIAYEVSDPDFNRARGVVRVDVVDGEDNVPPAPVDLEARVVAGTSVVIPVPLARLDEDGDSVRVFGPSPEGSPSLGSVVVDVDAQALVYEAGSRSGPDRFQYTVIDNRGAIATASVRVVVIAKRSNRSPVAVPDRIMVAPGAEVFIDPSSNDRDLDGDDLEWVFDRSAIEGRPGFPAADVHVPADGGRPLLHIDAGKVTTEGTFPLPYRVTDPFTYDEGFVAVDVRQQSTGLAPIARDDYPVAAGNATRVTSNVRANDVDPDGGGACGLEVSPVDEVAGVAFDRNGILTVPMLEDPQAIMYEVTDCTGLSARAVVWVPARGERPPRVREDALLEVEAGGTGTEIVLGDLVEDPDGQVSLEGTATSPHAVTARLSESPPVYEAVEGAPATSVLYLPVLDARRDGKRIVFPLAVPVKIVPKENQPPVWSEQLGELEFDPFFGQEQPYVLEQKAMVTDVDGDDLTFELADGSIEELDVAGIDVAFDEDRGELLLARKKDEQAPAPGVIGLEVIADDGKGGRDDVELVVRVVEPELRIEANPDLDIVIDQGDPSDPIDVLANDVATNDQGQPIPVADLDIDTVQVDGGDAVGAATVDRETPRPTIRFTPGPDFFGPATLSYTLTADVPGSPQSIGRVTILVRGPPDKPTEVRGEDAGDTAIRLTWRDGDANYAEITGYVIEEVSGAIRPKTDCPVGRGECVLTKADGLQPGVTYSFWVAAVNEVRRGDRSAGSSNAVTADERPGTATEVTAVGGWNVVNVTWRPPEGGGTLTGYRLDVTCGGQRCGPSPVVTPKEADRWTIDLPGSNGTQVCVTVVAVGPKGDGAADPPGCTREPEHPYGTPTVAIRSADPTAKPREVLVTWVQDDMGRAIDEGATEVISSGCDPWNRGFEDSAGEEDVRAVLLTGCGDTGFVTVRIRHQIDPNGVRPGVSLEQEFKAHQVPSDPPAPTLVAQANGVRVDGLSGADLLWQYRFSDGGEEMELPSTRVVAGNPGQKITLQVRACKAPAGVPFDTEWCSGFSTSAGPVTVLAPILDPVISHTWLGAGRLTITVSWDDPYFTGTGAATVTFPVCSPFDDPPCSGAATSDDLDFDLESSSSNPIPVTLTLDNVDPRGGLITVTVDRGDAIAVLEGYPVPAGPL